MSTLEKLYSRTWFVFFICFIVLIPFALLKISDKEFYRYGLSYGPCLNQLINSNSTEYDLVIVGGSRILAALNPYELSDVFSRNHQKNLRILNIAVPWYGMDYSFPVLRDLMEKHKVNNFLIAAQMQPGEIYHPFAFSILKFADLFEVLALIESNPVEHYSVLIKSLFERLRRVITRNEGGWKKWNEDLSNRDFEIKYCLLKQSDNDIEDVDDAKEEILQIDLDPKYSYQANRYSIFYYKKIKELAAKNNTSISYIWLPRLDMNYWTDESANTFQTAIATDSPVLVTPPDVLEKLYDDGFRDRAHINKKGREILLPWLADELNKHIQ